MKPTYIINILGTVSLNYNDHFFNEFQKMMKIIFDPNQFETLTKNALGVCLISFATYFESFRLLSLIFYEFFPTSKKSDWLSFLLGVSIYII